MENDYNSYIININDVLDSYCNLLLYSIWLLLYAVRDRDWEIHIQWMVDVFGPRIGVLLILESATVRFIRCSPPATYATASCISS